MLVGTAEHRCDEVVLQGLLLQLPCALADLVLRYIRCYSWRLMPQKLPRGVELSWQLDETHFGGFRDAKFVVYDVEKRVTLPVDNNIDLRLACPLARGIFCVLGAFGLQLYVLDQNHHICSNKLLEPSSYGYFLDACPSRDREVAWVVVRNGKQVDVWLFRAQTQTLELHASINVGGLIWARGVAREDILLLLLEGPSGKPDIYRVYNLATREWFEKTLPRSVAADFYFSAHWDAKRDFLWLIVLRSVILVHVPSSQTRDLRFLFTTYDVCLNSFMTQDGSLVLHMKSSPTSDKLIKVKLAEHFANAEPQPDVLCLGFYRNNATVVMLEDGKFFIQRKKSRKVTILEPKQ